MGKFKDVSIRGRNPISSGTRKLRIKIMWVCPSLKYNVMFDALFSITLSDIENELQTI